MQMQRIKENENLPLIITIAATVLLMIGGIAVLSKTDKGAVSEEVLSESLTREGSPTYGSENAEVTIVEFSDFQCSACAGVFPAVQNVKESYSDRVKIVYRHFPLTSIHPKAEIAAEAAEAAAAQNKFWEFHDELYTNQIEWGSLEEDAAINKFVEYAQKIGIQDIDQFKQDIETRKYKDFIIRDKEDAEALGLSGTPTFFINGKKIKLNSFDDLTTKVEEALTQ